MYLASMAPTLVQAVASWPRGSVRIEKLVVLENSGERVAVSAASNPKTNHWLNTKPCFDVKLWVPKILLVYHSCNACRSQCCH